jgi:hypothetical protein
VKGTGVKGEGERFTPLVKNGQAVDRLTLRGDVERVQFSVPGESLEVFLIYGPTPKEVLSRHPGPLVSG